MDTSHAYLVKARKRHRCDACGTRIGPGQVYLRWAIFSNGSANTCRSHRACEAALVERREWNEEWFGYPVAEADLEELAAVRMPAALAEEWAEVLGALGRRRGARPAARSSGA